MTDRQPLTDNELAEYRRYAERVTTRADLRDVVIALFANLDAARAENARLRKAMENVAVDAESLLGRGTTIARRLRRAADGTTEADQCPGCGEARPPDAACIAIAKNRAAALDGTTEADPTARWTVIDGELRFGDQRMDHNLVRCRLSPEHPDSGANYLTREAFDALRAALGDSDQYSVNDDPQQQRGPEASQHDD